MTDIITYMNTKLPEATVIHVTLISIIVTVN